MAEHGFTRLCCDELIQEKLASELSGVKGRQVTMGEWMGFPYEAGYEEREARYLALERETMAEIIAYLKAHQEKPEDNTVVDTTGSVIYTGNEILEKLRKDTTVVYLAVTAEVREQLLRAYISNPHPMLWKGGFHREPPETNREALVRCYPLLVSERQRAYEQLADVTIPYHTHRAQGISSHDFLRALRLSGNPI
jgi:shikimate kinase